MLAVAAMLPCVVEAQVVLPGGVSPGQVNPSLQREQIDAQRRQQAIEERARRVDIPALQGEQPEQGDALPADSPPFVLSGISFNTSVFITQEQLKEIAGQYVGREITFADLNQMIRQVNKLYADDGQLTARAIIPPQSLDDGQLRVVLVEATDGQAPKNERVENMLIKAAYRRHPALEVIEPKTQSTRNRVYTHGPVSGNVLPR